MIAPSISTGSNSATGVIYSLPTCHVIDLILVHAPFASPLTANAFLG